MRKRKKQLVAIFLGSVLLLGGWEAVCAAAEQEQEQEFSLDEYVVTASRIPVKLTQTAANVTVITQEEIEQGRFASVPEILGETGVTIKSTGAALSSSVVINGDYRVLILVDGRKINNDFISTDRDAINLDLLPSVKNIERIEIVRGSGSSLYGSDAVGGVINIITRKATEANTSFSTEFGSWGLRRYSFKTENKVGDIGYLITAERKRQDDFEYKDYQTGKVKRMANSYVDQDTLTLRLDKELSDGRSLTLYLDHSDNRWGNSHMAPGMPYHFPTAYKTELLNNVALTYRWNQESGRDSSFTIYRNYTHFILHKYMEGYSSERTRDFTNGVTGAQWQQTWQLNKNNMLTGGAEWRRAHVVERELENETVSDKAIFIEDRWQLPSNWMLTAGTRYDNNSNFGGKTSSRVSLNREMNKYTNVYASWGQFFKAPFVEELYGGGAEYLSNPNLRPESGDTITVGINTQLSKDTKVQASVFRSRVKDAIVWTAPATPGDLWTLDNLANEKKYGGEISLSHKLSPYWNMSVGYSYLKMKKKDDDDSDYYDDPDNSHPHGYRLNVKYNQDKWNAGLSLRGATGRSLNGFTSDRYWVVDINADYQVNSNLHAYFKVYNLTNRAYELTGSYSTAGYAGGFRSPARHFRFGVDYKL